VGQRTTTTSLTRALTIGSYACRKPHPRMPTLRALKTSHASYNQSSPHGARARSHDIPSNRVYSVCTLNTQERSRGRWLLPLFHPPAPTNTNPGASSTALGHRRDGVAHTDRAQLAPHDYLSRSYNQTSMTEQLVTQTILHLPQISDPLLECECNLFHN
jgi:hypothetical protein